MSDFINRLPKTTRITYVKKRNGKVLESRKWKPVIHCTEAEKKKANLFEIYQTLVVFDAEDEKQKNNAQDYIDEKDFSYELYNSATGYHYHLEFPELLKKTKEEAKQIREYLIKQACTCPSKKSGALAMPGRPHFKSGRQVQLIEKKDKGINCLPLKALAAIIPQDPELSHEYKPSKALPITECRLLDYCLKHRLKSNTGRGSVLFANFAVLLKHTKPDKAVELLQEFSKVQGVSEYRWFDHVCRKKTSQEADFRCGQIRKWLRQTQDPMIEYFTCHQCKHNTHEKSKSKN